MARMLTCYSDFIARVTEAGTLLGSGVPAAQLRDALNRSLAEARAAVAAAGRNENEEAAASFAVVAWADEVLVHVPGSEWGSRIEPLQKQHFRTLNAGNEFFQRLKVLGTDEAEIAEVYYAVLCLGFRGQYERDPNGPTEIRNWRHQLALQLPSRPPRLELLAAEHAFPQPYGIPDPGPAKIPFNWRPYVLAAAAAAVVLMVGAGAWWYHSLPRSVAEIEADALARTAGYDCSDLSVSVDAGRRIQVAGYVSSEADRERLEADMASVEDAGGTVVEAVVHTVPICEVLGLLKPYVQATDPAVTPRVEVSPKTGGTRIGNKLVLEAQASGFDGHVYIDLYDPDGNVLHVLPNQVTTTTFRPGRNRFVLGEVREGGRVFDLLPPPGEHLVTIVGIAGMDPLFAAPRPEVERAADYLPALREALAASERRSVQLSAGAPLFIDVVP